MRSTLVSRRLSGSLSLWVTLKSPKWCEDIIMIIIVLLNLYWTKVFCYTFDPCTLIYLFLAPEIFWKGLAVARYCCSVLDVHFWRLSQRVLQCLTIFKCFNALEYLIYFVAFLLFEAGLKMGRYTQQQFSLNGHCFMSWWQHLFAKWQTQSGSDKLSSTLTNLEMNRVGFSPSRKAGIVITVESNGVIPVQSFVLSRMAKVFSPVTRQDVWDPLTAWPTSFSMGLPRIRKSLSSLWSLLSSLKQNDPCFLVVFFPAHVSGQSQEQVQSGRRMD